MTTRTPSRAERADRSRTSIGRTGSGTRTARRSAPGSSTSAVSGGSGGPVTCASAVSYEAKERSDGSEIRVATIRGAPRRVPPS